MVKGTEFRMGWRFEEDDGSPKDLTGYEVLIQIRQYRWSEEIIVSYNQDSPQITFSAIDGEVDLLIPASETNELDFDSGYIDCLVYTETEGNRSPAINVLFDTGVSNLED